MSQANSKKEPTASEVRVVVEVDGHPVGFINLDIERLWPLIKHRNQDPVPVEWMDAAKFESIVRAAVVKRFTERIQTRLYQTIGDEIVKAELEVESFKLKAEAAAQVFGNKNKDIEKLVQGSDRSPSDFYAFFWDYLLDERETIDLKKEWKAKGSRPR